MRSAFLIALLLLNGCYIGPSDSVPDAVEPAESGRLSVVLSEFSKQLKHDGTLPEPKALSTTDIAILFDSIIEYSHLGQGAYTQEVADQIARALETLEPNGEAVDLDPIARAQAVQIFADLAVEVAK